MTSVDETLTQIAELIRKDQFVDMESHQIEIKPVPPTGGEWKQIHISANAFLNTRGGTLIFGIKEEGQGQSRRYRFTGWKEHAEGNLKDIPRVFRDSQGIKLFLDSHFKPIEFRTFLDGRVAILNIDEMPADQKYCYYESKAYRRSGTGDHIISDAAIEEQENFKQEAIHARELQPMPGLTEADIELSRLNDYIYHLNQSGQIETIKPDLESARPFLNRKYFLRDNHVTVLGALVCAMHPGDCLGFRSHVHGYVDIPDLSEGPDHWKQIVRDKQDFVDNVFQLMEKSYGYLLRNIQVGVSAEQGGMRSPQYPDELLRETVNNALAHRDYAIDRQVILRIRPGQDLSIRNPGSFPARLLIAMQSDERPIRRIVPEAKPRNPKLADVLRVFRKWEGLGIGMSTLVNRCLDDQINLPYYRLHSEEVSLVLTAGKLLCDRMERLFESFNGYLAMRANANPLTQAQKLVLAYIMKSEWANEKEHYTVLLTPDNNHYYALLDLERAGLISKSEVSVPHYPIYVVDRTLMCRDYSDRLRGIFGSGYDALDLFSKQVLGVVYRFNNFSNDKAVSAKRAAYSLWYDRENGSGTIQEFDSFYRKVRHVFNKLLQAEFVFKPDGTRAYRLNTKYLETHLS